MEAGLRIFDRSKKKKVLEMAEPYGIEELPYLFLQTSRKLRIFSGILSKNELLKWLYNIRIDNIGLYFASVDDSGIRFNLDAVHLLAEQIKGNVLEISDEQSEKWFHGSGIELDEDNKKEIEKQAVKEGFIILKNNGDFIGIGKLTKTLILNYLPKERRIKNG